MSELTQEDVEAAQDWYSPRESEWTSLLAQHLADHRMKERLKIIDWLRDQIDSSMFDFLDFETSDAFHSLLTQVERGEYLK